MESFILRHTGLIKGHPIKQGLGWTQHPQICWARTATVYVYCYYWYLV